MKSVVLDMMAADQAHTRLAELYRQDLLAGELSDQSRIEIDNVIRACRAALDKLINGLHELATGSRSTSLYFPWKITSLDKLAWLATFPDEVSAALRASISPSAVTHTTNPVARAQIDVLVGTIRNPIPDLPEVYRSSAHHGNIEYADTRTAGSYSHDERGVPVPGFLFGSGGMMFVDVPSMHFRGVPVEVTVDGEQRPGLADFVYRDLGQSVMGYLIELNNRIAELYRSVASTLGWDNPDAVRGFAVFYTNPS